MVFSQHLLWFLIGTGFLIAEFMLPGFIMIFFTIGCWVTALIVWQFDFLVTEQILIFITSSLVTLFLLRKYLIDTFSGDSSNDIDTSFDDVVGETAEVIKEIKRKSRGEIKYRGSFWTVIADDNISSGARVRIIEKVPGNEIIYKVKED